MWSSRSDWNLPFKTANVCSIHTQIFKFINNNKNKQNDKYLRKVIIKCPLVLCQSSIARLLERGNTPWLQWICTVCPYLVTIWEKVGMLFIEASGSKSICIMDTPRLTKRRVHNHKVMWHNNCLELN
jgi:hypothetical protein